MNLKRLSLRFFAAVALAALALAAALALMDDAAEASSHRLAIRLAGNRDFPLVLSEGQSIDIKIQYPCRGDDITIVVVQSTAESGDYRFEDVNRDFPLNGCGTLANKFWANQDTDTDDERFTVYLTIAGRGRVSPFYEVLIRDDDAPVALTTFTATAAQVAKPAAPTALSATGKHNAVDLSWTAPSGTITDYEVCTKSGSATCDADIPGDWTSTGSTSTTYTVGSLTNGTAYKFQVRAKNSAGVGPATAAANATPAAAAVTPTTLSIAENSTGSYTVVLNGAPNSNVTVTPSSSAANTVTLSPTTLTFTSDDWSTAQIVTVKPVDNHAADIPARSTTISHSASGGGFNGATIDSVSVTLTDNDVIVTNLDKTENLSSTSCSDGHPSCPITTSFTTGSHEAGYTLTSATIHPHFTSSSGNSATVNEVAVYSSGTSNCHSVPHCPQTRLGSALSGLSTLTRTTHHHTNVTYTSPSGIKLEASTTYWLVFDVGTPAKSRITNSADQTSTDSWTIGDQVYGKTQGTWRNLFSGTWPMPFAIGAQKLPAAPTGLTATAGNTQVTLSWTDPSNPAITKYQICQKTSGSCNEATDGDWADISDSDASTTSHRVTSLTNNTNYKFEIRAFVAGPGPASAEVNATPQTATPAKPSGLTATAKDASVDLAWTDPQDASITKWQYQSSTSNSFTGASWTDVSSSTAATTTATVGSLTNDTTYYFRIRAVNSSGNSPTSDSANATPIAVPSAPTGFSAAAKNASVTLSWTDPNNTSITKYQYQQSASSAFTGASWTDMTSSTASTTSYDVGGLTNGTTYYFRIRAVNASGNGASSGSQSATPGVPAKPSGFTATGKAASVDLAWTNPSDSSITKYQYLQSTNSAFTGTSWTDMTSSTASTTSYDVGGLTNGTTYYFRIRAVNASGNGTASSAASAIPSIPPRSAPAGLEAFPAAAAVWISWTNPQDSTITGYQYRQSTSSSFTSANWQAVSGSSATTTGLYATGLTTGTTYYFQVRAVGSGGNSAASATVAATPGTPDTPTGLSAAPGNGQVTLSWNFGYLYPPITKYQYCRKTGSASCDPDTPGDWTDIPNSGNGTVRHVVSGLTNSTEYKFKLRAVNSSGNSPPSNEAKATPASSAAPVAPTGITVTGGNASVRLSWTNPSDSTITGYEYQSSTSTTFGTSWTAVSGSGSATTTATMGGLTNAQKYYVRIRAVNANGGGDPSAAVTATPLGAPTLQTPAVEDRHATLTWSAVTGAAGYHYCRTTSAASCTATDWLSIADEDTNPNTVTATVRGLTNDTTYTFKVRAINTAYTIVESNAVTVTPTTTPGKVTGLQAAAGGAQATLTWTAPSRGGAPANYEYCQKTDSSACASGDWTSTGATSTSKVVSGLTNGTTYTFRVRAKNGAGAGPMSDAVTAAPVAAPSAVAALSAALVGSQQIKLSWTAAANGSITKYQFCQKEGGTAVCNAGLNHPDWADITGSTWLTASYTVVGLNNGTQYSYRVRAVNRTGAGAASGTASATPQGAPAAPANLTATPGVGRITLAWTAPVGWAITGYEYCQKTDSSACASGDWSAVTGSTATTTSYTVMGLSNADSYRFSVRARNAQGAGTASGLTAGASPSASPAPAKPQNLTVVRVGNTSVTLRWTWTAAPGGGHPLDQMRALQWKLINSTLQGEIAISPTRIGYDWNSGTGTFEITTTGLGTLEYTLSVKAQGGPASDTVTARPTATPPPAKPNLTAAAEPGYPGEVSLTWSYDLDTLLDPNWVTPTGWQYELNGVWMDGEGCDGGCAGMTTGLRLDPGATYVIRVRALNGTTPGPASDPVTVTTQRRE